MDNRNYWEEIAGKAKDVDVKEAVEKWVPEGARCNFSEKHVDGCHCTFCEPPQESLHEDEYHDDFGNKIEAYVSPYTPEQIKAYFKKLKEEDKELPSMGHPEFVSEKDTMKALLKFRDYEEGDLLNGQVIEVADFGPKGQLDGILVFYIDVGSLPPVNAEALVDRMRERLRKDVIERMPSNWTTMWIPTREQGTSVEAIRFNG